MKKILVILMIFSFQLYAKDKKMDKKKLTDMQYKVTQEGHTEPAFKNEYWDNKRPGIYVDVTTGEPLFSSTDKFDSGTGWPSFTKGIDDTNLQTKLDLGLGLPRTEVKSKKGDAHLGHVFDDGPKDKGGKRFCINSASLKFIPLENLEKEGYGKYLNLFEGAQSNQIQTLVVAGGCFWGMEEIIRKIPGVISTEVGYAGGETPNPTYDDVKKGTTGYAESVSIQFDANKVSYETLFDYFFRMHDPTTLNQQGNDKGTQYRSVIFYSSPEQQKIAQKMIEKTDKSGKWKKPVVTQVVPLQKFYKAEDYHQDYLVKNPTGYTCHFLR